MPDPAPESRPLVPADWRTWLALAWAVVFGVLYARMVLEERAPGFLRRIGQALGR